DDFCSWYLEWVKPGFEQPIDATVYKQTVYYFEQLMQLLHPFMPFITEEIYHQLQPQTDDLCVKQFADLGSADPSVLEAAELLKKVITALRDSRNKNQIKPKETVQLSIQTNNINRYSP
ncbi:class I tRNA ligase family protein, partial [Vibrio parahaemolyticus]